MKKNSSYYDLGNSRFLFKNVEWLTHLHAYLFYVYTHTNFVGLLSYNYDYIIIF